MKEASPSFMNIVIFSTIFNIAVTVIPIIGLHLAKQIDLKQTKLETQAVAVAESMNIWQMPSSLGAVGATNIDVASNNSPFSYLKKKTKSQWSKWHF